MNDSSENQVNTSVFADPLANEIEWLPVTFGGQNFRGSTLQHIDSSTLAFRPSVNDFIFLITGALFVLGGSSFMVFAFFSIILQNTQGAFSYLYLVLIPVITIPSIILFALFHGLRTKLRPNQFSKRDNQYLKGKRLEDGTYEINVPLADFYALQIITESHRSSSGRSYELNGVLRNGQRINIVEHGDLKKLQQDSNELASFLEIPVWDASHVVQSYHHNPNS